MARTLLLNAHPQTQLRIPTDPASSGYEERRSPVGTELQRVIAEPVPFPIPSPPAEPLPSEVSFQLRAGPREGTGLREGVGPGEKERGRRRELPPPAGTLPRTGRLPGAARFPFKAQVEQRVLFEPQQQGEFPRHEHPHPAPQQPNRVLFHVAGVHRQPKE